MIAADLRRFGALVIAPIVAVLAACTPAASEPAPTPTPSPSPSQTPFAEKNAAAIEAYKRYEEMLVDTATSGGYGPDDDVPESVLATTMGEERELVNKDNHRLKRDGERGVGNVRVGRIRLERSNPVPGAPGGHEVRLVSCRDFTRFKWTSAEGDRAVPETFQDVYTRLSFDETAPVGWKVVQMRSRQSNSC